MGLSVASIKKKKNLNGRIVDVEDNFGSFHTGASGRAVPRLQNFEHQYYLQQRPVHTVSTVAPLSQPP